MEMMMTVELDTPSHAPTRHGVPGVEYGGLGSLRLEEHERGLIVEALRRCAGCKTRAADLLGITRFALLRRLKEHGIESGRPYRRRTHLVPVP